VARISGTWPNLKGLRVAIQGSARRAAIWRGSYTSGAKLVVADVKDDAVRDVSPTSRRGRGTGGDPRAGCRCFCPLCARAASARCDRCRRFGHARLRPPNNQLAEPRHGEALRERGITYVPDYVVNAGGMMAPRRLSSARPSREASRQRILGMRDTILPCARGGCQRPSQLPMSLMKSPAPRITGARREGAENNKHQGGKTMPAYVVAMMVDFFPHPLTYRRVHRPPLHRR